MAAGSPPPPPPPLISSLEKLTAFLSTVRGTDKAFMLTAYLSKILIWGLKKRGSAGSLVLAERIGNLASPVSDTRMLLRYYGLLPLIQWIRCVEDQPPASPFLLWLYRAQNAANLFYYPLEHLYWLAAHKVIPLSDATRDKCGQWSCRFWASYVVLYFVQLYHEYQAISRQQLKLLKSTTASKTGSSDAEDPAFVKKQISDLAIEKKKVIMNTLINTAYFPLTVHWSVDQPFLSDVAVGVCGSIAAVLQIAMSF